VSQSSGLESQRKGFGKWLKIAASFLLDLFLIYFGINLLTGLLGEHFLRLHTPLGILIKTYAYATFPLLLLGMVTVRVWNSWTAVWAWLPPSVVLVIRALSLSHSAGPFSQLSGITCVYSAASEGFTTGCRVWLFVTIMALRACCYSLGAWIARRSRLQLPIPVHLWKIRSTAMDARR
jgi:hypothetical protein